jgi:integrase
MADTPYMANNVITALRRVFSWAVQRGHVASNPAAKPGRIKAPKRRAVWSPAAERAFLDAAAKTDPMMGLAYMLAAYTAQRQGDILAMTWHQYSGAHITLRQAKTGTLVQVPCHSDLRAALDSAPRKGFTILTNDRGQRFKAGYFRNRWRAVTLAAGLDGLQHRDLRRTAMVRMSEAGCTTQQIAAVSGHEIATTTRILDTYIPRTARMAEAAILKWEGDRKQNKNGNDTAS